MSHTLADIIALLGRATHPAEIFGPLAVDQEAGLRRRYRALAAAAHPDRHPEAAEEAHRAFTALACWYDAARRHLARGTYGRAPVIDVTVRGRRYQGFAGPIRGDLCDLYPAVAGDDALLLKVARRPCDNDRLAAETRSLARIDRELAGEPVRAHFPTLADAFLIADATGARRQVNALREEPGVVSLAAVLRAMPGGLHPADAAWVFNRMLAALGAAHGLGLVHGAVHLDHVLVRPSDHNGVLVGWCSSREIGAPLRAISPRHADDEPPEVAAQRPATPATDIYLAARCVVRLLGGAGDASTLPPHVPAAVAALLRACLIPAPHRRPSDAWEVFDDFQAILREHYGPPAFRPFPLTV